MLTEETFLARQDIFRGTMADLFDLTLLWSSRSAVRVRKGLVNTLEPFFFLLALGFLTFCPMAELLIALFRSKRINGESRYVSYFKACMSSIE